MRRYDEAMQTPRIARIATALSAFLVASASSLAATDHFVGPGQAHAQIAGAIAVAQNGDRVFVMAGTYDNFLLEKAIEVRGAGATQTHIGNVDRGIGTRVSAIPAGAVATISDMGFVVSSVGVVNDYPLLAISDNPGTVVLQSVSVNQAAAPHFGAGLSVTDTARLIAQSSVLRGSTGSALGGAGESGVVARDSLLVLSDTFVRAGDFQAAAFAFGQPGAPAMRVVNCELELARVDARGGSGGVDSFTGASFPGGAAIELRNSHAVISGGPQNFLQGGEAPLLSTSSGGPALHLLAASSTTRAFDVVLVGGSNGLRGGTGPSLLVSADSITEHVAVRFPTLAVLGSPAPLGSNVVFEHSGESSSVVLRAYSAGIGQAFALPYVAGSLHLQPKSVLFLPVIALDGDGLRTSSAAVPALPALAGAHVWVQCVELAGIELRVSNPARLSFVR
jgi:hypothetical protein